MHIRKSWLGVAAAVWAGALMAAAAWAEVRLPSVFSDHMVLLRESAVPVWGKADPGEKVTVEFGGRRAETVAGTDGKWRAELTGLTPADRGEMVIRGTDEVRIKDVLVGEVWLASGQSNMDFRIARTKERYWCGVANEAEEIAAAKWPEIRMYIAEAAFADEPQDDVKGRWWVCSPETAGEFSAVGYYFARELHQRLGVPVGMVVTSFGASKAQAWISPGAMDAVPELAKIVPAYREATHRFESGEARKQYEADLKAWEEAAAKAKAENKPAPRKPGEPRDPRKHQHNAGVLYHAMLRPLAPYTVRGVIWYQGESNGNDVDIYEPLMTTLIGEWRQLWGKPQLPFLSVQLANYRAPTTQPIQANSQIARVREVQRRTGLLPGTATVTAVDIGDEKDVHPKNKLDVGKRLALAARTIAYGETVVWSGPTVKSASAEGDTYRIRFDHTAGGLVSRGKDGKLTGFALLDAAGTWHHADATIEGDSVLLRAPGVTTPKAARYAWTDNPAVSLYNTEGLPAGPFRTDE